MFAKATVPLKKEKLKKTRAKKKKKIIFDCHIIINMGPLGFEPRSAGKPCCFATTTGAGHNSQVIL